MTESFLKQLQDRARELDKSATEGIVQFIPPGLRRLKPSLDFVQSMFPSTVLREAGGKTQKFIRSGGKDYKSGIGALVDTASVGIPLGVFGRLAQRETPKAVEGVTDFFMTPSVKTVDDAVDVSRRAFLKKAPVAVAATAMVPPVLREIGEVIPTTATTKAAKVGLKGAIGSAAAKANKLRDLYFGTEKALKGNPVDQLEQSLKINKEMDAITMSMNKELSDFVKGKNYDDFMKLEDDELIALGTIQQDITHVMRTGNTPKDIIYSGDPLRDKTVSEAISKAIDDRGLRDKVGDITRARMFESLAAKREARKRAGFIGERGISLPGDINPLMFPSGTTAKTTSLFPNEAKKGRQLLIVSCGDKKCPDVGNMKALDRYLGPIFESIKKEGLPENVDVAILSAKHGLIRADTPIENYNQLMTKDKVNDFLSNPNEMNKIAETMQGYDNVLVQGGDNYKNVIKSAAGDIPFTEVPKGRGIGDQRSFVASSLKFIKNPSSQDKVDTLFEAMDEEGALLEFPELGEKLNRYTFNNDRDALIEAITDEDYPAYEAAMKGMLERTFPSGKIPVRRVENYTELQLFGTKDPETLAMMEQAGLRKLKDQKKVVTEKYVDIEDVKFVGNPAEEELIILDTPRPFRKGAMIGDKQLLSYTIKLPKKVEKKAEGGIAGLSDVARDMFKGPKGIGAYQPFMVG